MMRLIVGSFIGVLITLPSARSQAEPTRPNILWISCEDISPNLGCYGDPHAITPNLDQLAAQGVRFTRAFTPAGVCAVVRSGVITGMYPPSIGSQHLRSRIIPPANVKAFAELLRASGYFTTNRSKTDYQFESTPSIWDRQGGRHEDWRERSDTNQPFFSVVNLTVCHESQIRHSEKTHQAVIQQIGRDQQHDPETVGDTLPPYLANTEATRKNWAWYHDNITLMDKLAGDVLNKLDQDGLANSTLVVFWSDHGMGMPRGKRWIYDTGTRIPMIIRWPGKLAPGSTREDLVSVLDLPPTMLNAAGVGVPQYMQGRILIGDNTGREPPYLFFHRDRMDEAYELQRAARDRRWKYIRNYQPEKPYSQHIQYMDQMPAMADWRQYAAAGKLQGGQMNWFAAEKPIEELYDTDNDPWELTNLADSPQFAERLSRMRTATEGWQQQIGDTGMIPEAVLMEEMFPSGRAPTTQRPTIAFDRDNVVSLGCPTEGASIVYQLHNDQGWSDWILYTKPFVASLSGDRNRVRAQASRLGFETSQVVESR